MNGEQCRYLDQLERALDALRRERGVARPERPS
jgi:hypothetical protein